MRGSHVVTHIVADIVTIALVVGCSSRDPESRPAPRPDVPIDAGVHQLALGRPVMPSGHIDGDEGYRAASPPSANRLSRPIDVLLRSTPSGAQVAVDGVVLGPTPAYWGGMADSHEHEFTFVLPGHAIARYRFVPVSSGTVHARLVPVNEDAASSRDNTPAPPAPPARQPEAPRPAPDAGVPLP